MEQGPGGGGRQRTLFRQGTLRLFLITWALAMATGAVCGAEFLIRDRFAFGNPGLGPARSPFRQLLGRLAAGAFGGGMVGLGVGIPFVIYVEIRKRTGTITDLQHPLAIACGTIAAHSALATVSDHPGALVLAAMIGGTGGAVWVAHDRSDAPTRRRRIRALAFGAVLCVAATVVVRILIPYR